MTQNRALSFALLTLLAAPVAFSQAPPTPPPPSGSGPGPQQHSSMPMMKHDMGERGGGMGIVPPGTWWKNPATVTALTLTADQQKKLDDIFLQSRISLIHLHASLEEEQLKLEPLLNANPPDQAKSLAQISKIADLRADLEKADAKMLLSLRAVLTADQWTKLQAEQHTRMEQMRDDRSPKRGPGAPGAPGMQRHPQGPGGPPPPPGQQGSVNPNGPDMPPPPAGFPAN